MKKAVLKLNLHDDKTKQKAMKTVSGIEGVNSVTMDMKDQKLTVTGDIDPVNVVSKLRKFCVTDIISVEAEKKEEAKKEEPKKPEEKKDELDQLVKAYQAYHTPPMAYTAYYAPPMNSYYVSSAEEDHNACVIC